MDYDFFLLTTFLLQTGNDKKQMQVRCLGSREILKANREVPKHISGTIEFEFSCIPVVDIGSAFGIEPIKFDNSTCILIVEHNYKSQKLYTGIIIQSFEEIEKLAAGIFELGTGLGTSTNMHFVLEMQNSHNDGHEILVESHKMLLLLEEPTMQISREYSSFQFNDPYDFINELQTMDYLQRQFILEELEKNFELWDPESNVMCI